ncbi:hypothetical protein F4778DRAFT_761171 [Xylariomycetidae sp. FL2044]|nr:hypothetical protein F4778DRAFT_761171 [Xylariomycetidae sp. FL2044]
MRVESNRLGLEQARGFDTLQQINSLSHTPGVANDMRTIDDIFGQLTISEKDIRQFAREQQLIKTLHYESRPYRHENIEEAHADTFKWIYSALDNNPQRPPTEDSTRFCDWLKSGTGTFWVHGKPGSGKSTMMKFCADSSKTMKALQDWGGSKRVVVAAHYFWSPGTAMQKSLKGLLQALLLDILRQCPQLAPEIFPNRWSETGHDDVNDPAPWSIDALFHGLQSLARHSSVPFKFCFFIDGLDEYDGDQYDLCQLLKELSSSENLKCCISSRPWNVFEDAFSADEEKKLCISDLTYQDIQNYVRSRLGTLPGWKRIYSQDTTSEAFVRTIAQRAQGVFLWVSLVAKSLRKGLINGDNFEDLQRRLDSLPTDLETYFKFNLDKVDPFYHQYMAETLLMTTHAKDPLHLMVYYARELENSDDNYAIRRPTQPDFVMTRPRLAELLESCAQRVNGRCGDLLCFNKPKPNSVDGRHMHTVEFIHRTVYDFILTGPMQDYLGQKTRPEFRPNLSILKARIYILRCAMSAEGSLENFRNMCDMMGQCYEWVDQAMAEDKKTTLSLLDNVLSVPHDLTPRRCGPLRDCWSYDRATRAGRYSRPIDLSAQEVLEGKWRKDLFAHAGGNYVLTMDGTREALLSRLIKEYASVWSTRTFEAAHALLDAGLNPNQEDKSGLTLWERFICSDDFRLRNGDDAIFAKFLRLGASRTCQILWQNEHHYPLVIVFFRVMDEFLWGGHERGICRLIDEFLSEDDCENRRQMRDLFEYLNRNLHKLRPKLGWANGNMVEIWEHLIAKGHELGLESELELLKLPITKRFRPKDAELLVSMIERGRNQAHQSPDAAQHSKRPHDGKDETTRAEKKIRLDTVGDTV